MSHLRMHATSWLVATSWSGGTACSQAAVTSGHRVENGHPGGGWIGLGISPLIWMRRSGWARTRGVDATRASLYGWRGLEKNASALQASITRPRYITITRSATWRTTERS